MKINEVIIEAINASTGTPTGKAMGWAKDIAQKTGTAAKNWAKQGGALPGGGSITGVGAELLKNWGGIGPQSATTRFLNKGEEKARQELMAHTPVPTGQQIQIQLAMQPGQERPSYAYKRSTGWVNELGKPITNPASIKGLDDLLVGRGGTMMDIPQATPYRFTRKRNQPK